MGLGANLSVNGSNDLTLNGIVSGTGALIKNGAGNLTLNAVNTYNGTTTVNAGGLLVSALLMSCTSALP